MPAEPAHAFAAGADILSDVFCPAQAVLLVNVVYFAWLCHLTLPLYSLVVHMGSDIKLDALPEQLRERLARARAHQDEARGSI